MALKEKISDTLGAQVLFADANKTKLTRERWNAILRCKEEFLNDENPDPSTYPFMDQDVAASWMRSKKHGVNPHKVVTIPTKDKLLEVRNEHARLIDITKKILVPMKKQMVECGYLFYLFDRSGLILLHEGVWVEDTSISSTGSRVGLLVNEEAQGTSAHELCFRHKRPIQLLGPENYCIPLQNRIASAAPIMERENEVTAALVILSPPLIEPESDESINHLYMHTLGLITSMATAIESQLNLCRTREDYEHACDDLDNLNKELESAKEKMVSVHKTLTASFSFIEEGMVAVDSKGKILHINNEAIRIFKVRPEEIGNRNIREFLSSESSIMNKARKGETFTIEECVKVGSSKPSAYRISARPVHNQYTKKLDVIILKFVDCNKLNNQINNRSGRSASYSFDDLLGESQELKASIAQARRFSQSPENILLIGESGVGKELFAHSIHNNSRPKGPFMAVNCAALPSELVGSELFGYEKGSFTGAERCGKPGKIELAHGGTLFLDEIGDMPLEQQAILLRTLQDKRVMRVGGHSYKDVDFRLIAATNKDLMKMVEEKTFREDLYYRISVLTVYIPSLRERTRDVGYLSRVFVENYCQRHGWPVPVIAPEVTELLEAYRWPGNVRQLQNCMHHAINTITGDRIELHNLPRYVNADGCPESLARVTNFGQLGTDSLSLKQIEKAAIETALKRVDNCIPSAAELVGLSRSTLYRKLKEYNIAIA
ncbi:MAG: sigma-54-dependent Fis family transcriptional regulator [Desulfuromonas sp.]|nr:MAG: sigma-54-dependent Fis family transcriptional regulator [Desulfuromonas sp.]